MNDEHIEHEEILDIPVELRKIAIIGEITENTFGHVFISLLNLQDSSEPIEIIINSTGGDLYHTLAIYDLLRDCPCEIIAKSYGSCMSGGSIIMQAADKRILKEHSTMMIHYGSRGFNGGYNEYTNWSDYNKKIAERIVDIYAKRMKGNKDKNRKKVHSLLSNDSIFSSSEAVKLGLADKVEYNLFDFDK